MTPQTNTIRLDSRWTTSSESSTPAGSPICRRSWRQSSGSVVGESYTNPDIAEISVSEAENLVYIRQAGAAGFDGIQSLEDLRNNWNRLMDAAGLTPEEREEAVALSRQKVETVPGTDA